MIFSNQIITTARKTVFSFSRRPEKMIFPKKLRWNMIFLVLSGKTMFLFPENMIWHLRRTMKDDISQKKNTRKYDIFFKLSEKKVFAKRAAPWHDLSCIIWKDGIFSRKHDIFSWTESERQSFSKNIWKYIFCVHARVLQTWRHALLSKKVKDGLIPQKYT